MRSLFIIFVLFVFSLAFILSSCTMLAKVEVTVPSQSPMTLPQTNENQINLLAIREGLTAITNIDNYQNEELDDDTIGFYFWTETSAMLTIEFLLHPEGGMDLLEDYRTAANPESRVWLESPSWDTAIYYVIGDWDAETVAVVGEKCYLVRFVPSAYPTWDASELGAELLELFVASSSG